MNNKDNFQNWLLENKLFKFNDIYKKDGYVHAYDSPPVIDWSDDVINNHKEVKDKLNLDKFQNIKISLDKKSLNVAHCPIFIEFSREFYNITRYSIPVDFIINNELVPSTYDEKHYGMAWSKYYVKRIDITYTQLTKEERNIKKSSFLILWSKIKKYLSDDKISSDVYVSIRHDPYAFMRIGTFSCDPGSCFKQGGCNYNHKYKLGLLEKSFIFMISTSPLDETITNPKSVVFRCLGLFLRKDKSVLLFNHYTNNLITEQSVLSIKKDIVDRVLGIETRHWPSYLSSRSTLLDCIYFNQSSGHIYCEPGDSDGFTSECAAIAQEIDKSILMHNYSFNPTSHSLANDNYCGSCGRQLKKTDHIYSDKHIKICEYCIHILPLSEKEQTPYIPRIK